MMTRLNRYRLFLLALMVDLVLAPFHPNLARASVANSLYFAGELALILPAVMVLIGLFDAWVPREWVERNVGPGSGVRGVLLSIFLGTATAGPLYAAYPVAFSLQRKGTRLANIVIFLETWGAIKLSMILLESRFLGLRFALLRLAVTLPGVIGIGFLMERGLKQRLDVPAWPDAQFGGTDGLPLVQSGVEADASNMGGFQAETGLGATCRWLR